MAVSSFSDFIVYVDESGDHGLAEINPEYPRFVLAFCIFRIDDYAERIVPAVERLKFEFFGHDMVVLHEHEIRKALPPFEILLNRSVREGFMRALDRLVEQSRFKVVATVIRKPEFLARASSLGSPYHVALEFGLERVFLYLQEQGQARRPTFVVFEGRGKREDTALELEFRRIMDRTQMQGMPETLEFLIASKLVNSPGLQIADMIARPIGIHDLRPGQSNRAWDLIEPKLRRSRYGETSGYGLKVYP